MPIYTVQAPDGHTIDIEGPAGATHDQVVQMAQQLYNPDVARAAGAAASAGAAGGAAAGQRQQATSAIDNATGFMGMTGGQTRAMAHQIPLVGDLALTAGHVASDFIEGHPSTWQQANAEAHGQLATDQQTDPIGTAVGGAAGAGLSALGGGAALKAAGVGVGALPEASTFAARAANAGRLALAGGATGAAQAGLQSGGEQIAAGQQPFTAQTGQATLGGAATGAALGPAASGLASVGGKVLMPLAGKTAAVLAKIFKGVTPADLQATWRAGQAVARRPLTMAEITSLHQQGLIKDAAKNSEPITTALTQAAEDAGRARSDTMQATLAPPPSAADPTEPLAAPTQAGASSGEIANAKDAQGDLDYGAVRAHTFNVPGADTFGEDDATPFALASRALSASSVAPLARQTISRELQDGSLSGNSVDALRKNLTKRHGADEGAGYGPLRDEFLGVLADEPSNGEAGAALRTANANYAANAQRAAGASQGESILGTQTPANFAADAASKANANPNFPPGLVSGARSKLSSAAASPQGAEGLADKLKDDGNLQAKLTTVFGAKAADSLQALGEVESNAAAALAPYAKVTPPTDDTSDAAVKNVLHGMAAMAFHNPVIKANYLARLLSNVRMTPAVQAKVGEYLTTPGMIAQGVNLLKRAGVDSATLRQRVLSAAILGGSAGGSVSAGLADPGGVTIEDVRPATAAELAGQQ